MRISRWLTLGIIVAATASAGQVHAQGAPGYAIDHFEPSERDSEWHSGESLRFSGHGRPSVGMVTSFAGRGFVHYESDGDVKSSVVRNQLVTHWGVGFTLYERVRASFNVPLQLFADGHGTTFPPTATAGGVAPGGTLGAITAGQRFDAPRDEVAVGDLRFAFDVRVLGEASSPFRLAVGSQLFLPSGDPYSYTGDGEPRFLPRVLVAGESGLFAYSGRVFVQFRGRDEAFAEGAVGSELGAAATAGLRTKDGKWIVGPELFARSVFSQSNAFLEERTTPVEALLGAHYRPADDWLIGAGAGAGLTRAYGAPVARGLFSIAWVPSSDPKADEGDADADGIPDTEDACPNLAGMETKEKATNGCPPVDFDGDGIADVLDACPALPGPRTGDKKTNGCPEDRDHDGIYDEVDACIDEPGVKSADPKMNGCPADSDGDGVPDPADACPKQAGKRTEDPKTNGCPESLDRDGDGITNDHDACPDEKGAPSPDPKKNGCPMAFVADGQIKITQQVKFKTGSAQIDEGPASSDVLEAVLKILTDHPEIKKLRVEGHTDNVGSEKYNERLSDGRAASVKKWLVDHGIDASRLESEGFGPKRPIDSNDLAEGRQNNRRVELHIVDDSASSGAGGSTNEGPKPADTKPADAKPTDAKPTELK